MARIGEIPPRCKFISRGEDKKKIPTQMLRLFWVYFLAHLTARQFVRHRWEVG